MNRSIAIVLTSLIAVAGCATGNDRNMLPAPDAAKVMCHQTSEQEIAALFDRWNASLQSSNPAAVADQYTQDAILLPTLSNKPRLTRAERIEYFEHFLHGKPVGHIDMRHINIGCNTAIDSGLYTFSFKESGTQTAARYTYAYRWEDGKWGIVSHHSSLMPENFSSTKK